MEAKHAAAERELRSLKEAKGSLEAKATQAEREIQQLHASVSRIEQESKQLRTMLQSQKAESDRRVAEVGKAAEAERAAWSKQRDQLQAELDAALRTQQQQQRDAAAEIEVLRVEKASLVKENQQLQSRGASEPAVPAANTPMRDVDVRELEATKAELSAARASNEALRAQTAANAARVGDELQVSMCAVYEHLERLNAVSSFFFLTIHSQALRAEYEALKSQNAALRDSAASVQALQMQVSSLSQQLIAERDSTAEERQEEVATLKRTMERIRTLEETVNSSKEKEDLLKTHILEREEELEAMMNESALLKVELGRANTELSEARERAARVSFFFVYNS